jgi:hypothetical protein
MHVNTSLQKGGLQAECKAAPKHACDELCYTVLRVAAKCAYLAYAYSASPKEELCRMYVLHSSSGIRMPAAVQLYSSAHSSFVT